MSEEKCEQKQNETQDKHQNTKTQSIRQQKRDDNQNNNLEGGDTSESSSSQGLEYFMFLILILLFIGNQNTFNEYFNLLNQQTSEMKNLLETFSATADGLKSVMMTPQEIMGNN